VGAQGIAAAKKSRLGYEDQHHRPSSDMSDRFLLRCTAPGQGRLWHEWEPWRMSAFPPVIRTKRTSVVAWRSVGFSLPPPALRECRHRGLTRRCISVRGACGLGDARRRASTSTVPRPARHSTSARRGSPGGSDGAYSLIEYYRSRGELLRMAAGISNARRLALLDTDLMRYQPA
jgi:hypothetical protein